MLKKGKILQNLDDRLRTISSKTNLTKDIKKDETVKKLGVSTPSSSAKKTSFTSPKNIPKKI